MNFALQDLCGYPDQEQMTTNLGKKFDGLLIALLTIFQRVVFLQIWPRKHFVYFFVVKTKLLVLMC